jgi:hypothetical protein
MGPRSTPHNVLSRCGLNILSSFVETRFCPYGPVVGKRERGITCGNSPIIGVTVP